MVDTCAGGCMSRALAQTGTIHARDEHNCVVTRRINPELAPTSRRAGSSPTPAGSLQLDADRGRDGPAGMEGRLVALVPPFARRAWLADPGAARSSLRRPGARLVPDGGVRGA